MGLVRELATFFGNQPSRRRGSLAGHPFLGRINRTRLPKPESRLPMSSLPRYLFHDLRRCRDQAHFAGDAGIGPRLRKDLRVRTVASIRKRCPLALAQPIRSCERSQIGGVGMTSASPALGSRDGKAVHFTVCGQPDPARHHPKLSVNGAQQSNDLPFPSIPSLAEIFPRFFRRSQIMLATFKWFADDCYHERRIAPCSDGWQLSSLPM